MTTFITTLFVLYVLGVIFEVVLMIVTKPTLASVFKILTYVGMGTWAGFLLFVK